MSEPSVSSIRPTRVRAERIAAAARALGAELEHRLALYADAVAKSLEREQRMVAWDREQIIGLVQQRLAALRDERFVELGGPKVRVIERRLQPLESIELAWRQLRQGRWVRLEHEPGACSAVLWLMEGMGRVLRDAVEAEILTVAEHPWGTGDPEPSASSSAFRIALEHPDNPTFWPVVGPKPTTSRVAVVEANADRELAAYVLARAGLRRTGADPRNIKYAYVIGLDDRLQRHLSRLWVGTTMGPPDDPASFTGPVDEALRQEFLEAQGAWSGHEDVEVVCPGGELQRADDRGLYLAPALFATDWPAPELPTAGPMLVLVRCNETEAMAGAEAAAREGGQIVAVGARRGRYPGEVRYIRGALLVERLPPGLPKPRPV